MKVAVLGAGFAGLATVWQLLKERVAVTLFDPAGIGGQASAVSAGLLHTYVGLHAKYNLEGREGYLETENLLQVAERALGMAVSLKSGLLRPALTRSSASITAFARKNMQIPSGFLRNKRGRKFPTYLHFRRFGSSLQSLSIPIYT